MPAELENMFYVSNEANGRFVPWHGLGTPVEEAPNSKEALRLSGLDWKVESKPLFVDGREVPGYKANVRNTDGAILDVVSDRYQIVQNEEAFDFTDNLIGGDVKYETAGSLFGGKRTFILARLPETMVLGDEVCPYICFTNGFNKAYSIKAAITPVRVVCNNTLNFALNTTPRCWSTKHVGDMNSKLEQAKHTLQLANDYIKELNVTAERLADTKVSDEEVRAVLDSVFVTTDKDSDRRVKNIEEQKDNFMVCMLAPDIAKFRGTAWGTVQAASDYFTHRAPKRATESYKETNFAKVLDGNIQFDRIFMEMMSRIAEKKMFSVGVSA